MADPLPPPARPSLGPDKWWNPLSPSWPPTAAGRAVGETLKAGAQTAADTLERTAEAAASAADALNPDPIPAAVAIIGKPSWGFWAPSALAGAASLIVVGGVGLFLYKHRSGKKR
jgi:hypothetical protein